MSLIERAAGRIRRYWPGAALTLVVAVVADRLAGQFPALSGFLLALIAGIVLRACGWVPWWAEKGMNWCAGVPLHAGAALLGLQLLGADLRAMGWVPPALAAAAFSCALAGGWIAGRVAGVPRATAAQVALGVAGAGRGVGPPRSAVASAVVLAGALAAVALAALALAMEFLGRFPGDAAVWAAAGVGHPGLAVAAGDTIQLWAGDAGTGASLLALAVAVSLVRTLLAVCLSVVLPFVRRPDSAASDAAASAASGAAPGAAPGAVARRFAPLLGAWPAVVFCALVLYRSVADIPASSLQTATAVSTMLLTMGLVALGTALRPGDLFHTGGHDAGRPGARVAAPAVVAAACGVLAAGAGATLMR